MSAVAKSPTNDVRIDSTQPLVPPSKVRGELPVSASVAELVINSRNTLEAMLAGKDSRLLVISGPCSIHDPEAGLEYAGKLAALRRRYREELFIVMRVYFEKPRTRGGWKGLIYDPHLDESFDVDTGIRTARKLLIDIGGAGLPTATEFLDPVTPQYTADLVSWGCIGARTVESQVHRQMASGLSCPIGFKNTTSGGIKEAIDAIMVARAPQSFLSVDVHGHSAMLISRGNLACHPVLRGGMRDGKYEPNYDADTIDDVVQELRKAGLPEKVVVDVSHANSNKDHKRQRTVIEDLCRQLEQGRPALMGVMIESFLVEGRQDKPETFGQSITDACIGWEQTEEIMGKLADSSRQRMGLG